MKTFVFQYYTTTNSLSADDFAIKANMGPLIKREFSPTGMQHFYHFKNSQYDCLYITYTAEDGKTKKIQLYSNPGNAQFAEMVEYFNSKYPKLGLNHLPENEALKMMHIANPNKWVPPFVFILLSVCISIFFYPMLRHCFDKGLAQTTIGQYIANPDLGTRNVIITGTLLDVGVKETITSSKHGTSSSTFIPMVPANWKEGDPIKVILQFPSLTEREFDRVIEKTQFKGIIRDIWWEGMDSDNTDFLVENYKLNFPDKPTLIEMTYEDNPDGFALYVWLGTIVFILILVVFVAIKMRKK